jgi:hypothetical protein
VGAPPAKPGNEPRYLLHAEEGEGGIIFDRLVRLKLYAESAISLDNTTIKVVSIISFRFDAIRQASRIDFY